MKKKKLFNNSVPKCSVTASTVRFLALSSWGQHDSWISYVITKIVLKARDG